LPSSIHKHKALSPDFFWRRSLRLSMNWHRRDVMRQKSAQQTCGNREAQIQLAIHKRSPLWWLQRIGILVA
jgi:hypothetical protein